MLALVALRLHRRMPPLLPPLPPQRLPLPHSCRHHSIRARVHCRLLRSTSRAGVWSLPCQSPCYVHGFGDRPDRRPHDRLVETCRPSTACRVDHLQRHVDRRDHKLLRRPPPLLGCIRWSQCSFLHLPAPLHTPREPTAKCEELLQRQQVLQSRRNHPTYAALGRIVAAAARRNEARAPSRTPSNAHETQWLSASAASAPPSSPA
mmetsp:Transcript_23395/g.64393  ORF Transcript_23395/g.64393 Transcript_23395/m.64393 type:complete len:205 (+) Transcript_23395:1342-1956(+)